jgi:signal transduction histidine kinase
VEADWKVTHPDDRAPQAKLQEELAAGRIERYSLEKRYVRPDGSVVWAALTVRSFHDPSLGETQQISTLVDITGRMEAEASLRQMHQQLVETSRHAGMAEVATSVLHNVGNVLNSVNVSATVVADRVRRTKAVNIGKIAALLEEHKATLGAFLAADSRGQMIPAYLGTLAASLNEEQKVMLQELEHLRKNIEHIKDIVSMQQANARFSGVVETVPVSDMIEDAIRINAGSLDRHDVAVSRDFQAPIAISTDKHKVMQILINLIRNAKQACDEARATAKRVLVRTRCAGQSLEISIVDNGIGIPAENLRRIFNHGFTTRKNGHGFGLHSASLAAKELGGELRVTSDGPGTGATFILELPLDRAPEQSAAAGSTAPQPACASV